MFSENLGIVYVLTTMMIELPRSGVFICLSLIMMNTVVLSDQESQPAEADAWHDLALNNQ